MHFHVQPNLKKNVKLINSIIYLQEKNEEI